MCLLKDIINGNLPIEARQYLLASRLVALTKPSGDMRPIAVGELLYRLAAVIAVSRVSDAATKLLAPHQYGVGVSSGAERILHSVQHALTDGGGHKALLKIDISNAFNTCDRARVLRELYARPELAQLHRIADFAYSSPSPLLLQGCLGATIASENGVRQGDPLSAILFCVYMRDVLRRVAKRANVTLYAFFDDINIVGEPTEVMRAFSALQLLLPSVSLTCNTAKSNFVYFHDSVAPLMRRVKDTLAENNITVHREWIDLVGAVVGRDAAAIKAGHAAQLAADRGNDAFFRRLELEEMPVQSALQLLRQCATPRMNFTMRCTPPECIADQAARFDEQVMHAAATCKLKLRKHEQDERVQRILRSKLRHGGFGLTSALQTSPAAYLGSLAAVRDARVLAVYSSKKHPLPASTQLHDWIQNAIDTHVQLSPDSATALPAAASAFFHHFTTTSSSVSSSLQSTLSEQATSHIYEASLTAAKQARRDGNGMEQALLMSISAPRAWTWKTALPTQKSLVLSNSAYRLAARLNLGLKPEASGPLSVVSRLCSKCDTTTEDTCATVTENSGDANI